jgi:hypothetical protein
VIVLVKNLYIVLARAIGLWFVRIDGSDFCIVIWLDWFSMKLGFVVVYNIGGIGGIVGYGIVLAYFLV